jgi:hypothetical protein
MTYFSIKINKTLKNCEQYMLIVFERRNCTVISGLLAFCYFVFFHVYEIMYPVRELRRKVRKLWQ